MLLEWLNEYDCFRLTLFRILSMFLNGSLPLMQRLTISERRLFISLTSLVSNSLKHFYVMFILNESFFSSRINKKDPIVRPIVLWELLLHLVSLIEKRFV